MNKISKKILSLTAEEILEAALAAAGLASNCGSYQEEEPKGLREMAEARK